MSIYVVIHYYDYDQTQYNEDLSDNLKDSDTGEYTNTSVHYPRKMTIAITQ